MKYTREVKTALLVLAGILFFIIGFNYLKGSSVFERQLTLYTIYPEVEGLVPGAKVTLNGLTIGRVTALDFQPGTTDIYVQLQIREGLNLSSNSKAILYETGIIGGMAIKIEPVFDDQALQSNDTLSGTLQPGFTELVNRQIAPLQEKIEHMLSSADSVFSGVSNVLNNDTQNNLKNTLTDLSATLQNLNEASSVLVGVLNENRSDFQGSMKNLNHTSENIAALTDSLAQADLKGTIDSFQQAASSMQQILAGVEQGSGTLGQLVNNDSLYREMEQATKAMEALLTDLKAHPKRYVHFSIFGRKEKQQSND
ncbi:MAG: MlaD family protein [Flavobacteriaceae bacterium]